MSWSAAFRRSGVFPRSSRVVFFSGAILLSLVALSFFFTGMGNLGKFGLTLCSIFISPKVGFSSIG